jgi:hypothetical protein
LWLEMKRAEMGEPVEAPAGIPRAQSTAAVGEPGSSVAMSRVFEEMAMILPRYLDPPSSVAMASRGRAR